MSVLVVLTASIREIDKLPKTAYKVLITRYFPFWVKGLKNKINEYLPILAPSEELLTDYKKELKKTGRPDLAWNLATYDFRFRHGILRSSEALAAIRRIKRLSKEVVPQKGELAGERVVYLICHEPTDEFCHRRIVKELLEKYNLGD